MSGIAFKRGSRIEYKYLEKRSTRRNNPARVPIEWYLNRVVRNVCSTSVLVEWTSVHFKHGSMVPG